MLKAMTIDETIDALGGTGAVARLLDVGAPAVSNWRKAGRIPPRQYFRFAEIARKHKVKLDPGLFREASESLGQAESR
jgi:hypothetical protein